LESNLRYSPTPAPSETLAFVLYTIENSSKILLVFFPATMVEEDSSCK